MTTFLLKTKDYKVVSDIEITKSEVQDVTEGPGVISVKRNKFMSSARSKKMHKPKRRKNGRHEPRRCSARGASALSELASHIVGGEKKIVFITGAGLSVASGIRPFRTTMKMKKGQVGGPLPGIWNDVIWTTATRRCFQKDPLAWYNNFWIPHFHSTNIDGEEHKPNAGHEALQFLLMQYTHVSQITQNIDALQSHAKLIEAHGRLGLYKCMGQEDSDDDEEVESVEASDEDDDDPERLVFLGHRRSARLAREQARTKNSCQYQFCKSLYTEQLNPPTARDRLLQITQTLHLQAEVNCQTISTTCRKQRAEQEKEKGILDVAPRCPACKRPAIPQALLFDEGYHSHAFYQCERIEDLLAEADVLVFVGTSFSVRITSIALDRARSAALPVYNLNVQDMLKATTRLNVTNIIGPAAEILPKLVEICLHQEELKKLAAANGRSSTGTADTTRISPVSQLSMSRETLSTNSSSTVTTLATNLRGFQPRRSTRVRHPRIMN